MSNALVRAASFQIVGGLSLVALSALGVWRLAAAHETPPTEACGVPYSIDVGSLPERERVYHGRRAAACVDYEAGRISLAEYRAEVATLDYVPAVAAPEVVWASDAVGFSSQYSDTTWSAAEVIGPPDVYPTYGDDARAWAPATADEQVEFIEVAFADAHRASSVDIYETFNPGAITRVQVKSAAGEWKTVLDAAASPAAEVARVTSVELGCNDEPIVAARIELDARAVPGWQEIDAVALRPCR